MQAVTESDVTVIVITRNRSTVLAQCLDHLEKQTLQVGSILVIDSSDTFVPLSAKPNLKHVHFPPGRNQMPMARNEGIRLAQTKILAFIDDDCLADPDWLEQLLAVYSQIPSVHGVGGRITDPRWKYEPESPVGQVDSRGRVISNFFGDPGCVTPVQILPGGNMSFRKDSLLEVGGFDPSYVATNHREDPDLCLRLKELGAELYYQPKAHAVHLNARNLLGELRPWHEFYLRYSFARNEAFFLCRHFPSQVPRRWLTDSFDQLRKALKARSIVALLCAPLQLLSYGIGICAYRLSGRKTRGQNR